MDFHLQAFACLVDALINQDAGIRIKQNNEKRETKQQDSLSVQVKTENTASLPGNQTPASRMIGRDTHHYTNEEDITINSRVSTEETFTLCVRNSLWTVNSWEFHQSLQ